MSRPVFPTVVHIEGMDLAGKSSVSDRFVSKGWPRQRNSLIPMNPIYDFADELRRGGDVSADALGPAYVAALVFDLEHVREPDGPLVQDSTILLRSLAFNEVAGSRPVVAGLLEQLGRHPVFGHSIVLTATIDDRRRRLDQRRAAAPEEVAPDDLMVETEPKLFMEMERLLICYAQQHFDAITVDTSEMSKRQVWTRVQAIVRRRVDRGAHDG